MLKKLSIGKSQLPECQTQPQLPGEDMLYADKRSLQILLELNSAIVSINRLPQLLEKACQLLQNLGGCDSCGIYLYHAETEQFIPAAICDRSLNEDSINKWKQQTIKRDRASSYDRLLFNETGYFEVKPELSGKEIFLNWLASLSGSGNNFQKQVVFPLVYQDEVLGLVGFGHSTENKEFGQTGQDSEALASAIKLLGYAVANDRLKEQAAQPDAGSVKPDPEAARPKTETAAHFNEEIVSQVAHELRNPIGIIRGYSQLTKKQLSRLKGTELQHETLDLIIEQTSKVNRLIEDLLDSTRIKAGNFELNMEPCDLAAIARRTIEVFQFNSPGIVFVLELKNGHQKGEYTGLYDVDRLDQVLTNLVSNAVKYSSDKGCIILTLQHQTVQEIGCVENSNPGFKNYLAEKNFKATDKLIHFSISDKGIGIPPEQQPEVFNYLFRSSNTRAKKIAGLGLGLFISRQIVTGLGGVIWVESPGENLGTTVHFVLPG